MCQADKPSWTTKTTGPLEQIPRQTTKKLSCGIYLILQRRDELLVTGQPIRAILDEHAQCPELERRLAVLFDNVEVREIDASAHLADLLNNSVDPLREGVFKRTQGRLSR